jgi:hypothetical protein
MRHTFMSAQHARAGARAKNYRLVRPGHTSARVQNNYSALRMSNSVTLM